MFLYIYLCMFILMCMFMPTCMYVCCVHVSVYVYGYVSAYDL